jgi:hypothetical protein
MDPHRVYWPIRLEGDNHSYHMGLEVVEGDRNMEEQAIVLNLGG